MKVNCYSYKGSIIVTIQYNVSVPRKISIAIVNIYECPKKNDVAQTISAPSKPQYFQSIHRYADILVFYS